MLFLLSSENKFNNQSAFLLYRSQNENSICILTVFKLKAKFWFSLSKRLLNYLAFKYFDFERHLMNVILSVT